MSFFHGKASSRAKTNRIDGLEDGLGHWCTSPKDIERVISEHFQAIFPTTNPSQQMIDDVLEAVESRVTDEMNERLLQPYMEDEIKTTLFQMHPNKSPGPDEALISLILKEEQSRNLQGIGIAIARTTPKISHLFFADDTLLFSLASIRSADTIRRILGQYKAASGQMVNFNKAALVFSRFIEVQVKVEIAQILQVWEVDKFDTYLGLPAIVGKSKKTVFSYLRERIWKRVQGWNEKRLSRAGREVLIKVVLQYIPAYVMGCFLLPSTFIRELESIIRRFWWSGDSTKVLHWVGWRC